MKDDISIVLCGEAGQGIQTVESLLVKIFKSSGFNVFATKEYMSRVRGGSNSTSLRISSNPVSAYIDRIDLLIKLGKEVTRQVEKRISNETKVFSDIKNNVAAIGLVCSAFKIEQSVVEKLISERFKSKGDKIVAGNIAALKEGYALVDFVFDIKPDPRVKDQIILSGSEAVAFGAIAGMIESPLVINLAQRPGPSTGLPTRTEQGDLEIALYSGHGEFPRIILAPGNLSDAFSLAKKAFDMADKYQVPVFIMTDQYLGDSYCNIPSFSFDKSTKNHFVKSSADYQRYKLTDNGISPRGIPGHGDGFVCVDSRDLVN